MLKLYELNSNLIKKFEYSLVGSIADIWIRSQIFRIMVEPFCDS